MGGRIVNIYDARKQDIAERWRRQYQHVDGTWPYGYNTRLTYERLAKVDRAAPDYPEQCDAVIGNNSWTHERCIDCESYVRRAVIVPDGVGGAIALCETCVQRVVKMLAAKEAV